MRVTSTLSSVCANRSRIHSRVARSPLSRCPISGHRVDERLTQPKVEPSAVKLEVKDLFSDSRAAIRLGL